MRLFTLATIHSSQSMSCLKPLTVACCSDEMSARPRQIDAETHHAALHALVFAARCAHGVALGSVGVPKGLHAAAVVAANDDVADSACTNVLVLRPHVAVVSMPAVATPVERVMVIAGSGLPVALVPRPMGENNSAPAFTVATAVVPLSQPV